MELHPVIDKFLLGPHTASVSQAFETGLFVEETLTG